MDADNRGPQLAAVVIVLLVLCWVSVSLRCYTMGFVLRKFYREDWLAIYTLLIYTAYSVCAILGTKYGLGAHTADVPIENHPKALFCKWAGQVLYVLITILVKFIVGLLLLRLCADKRWQRITLWTLLIVSAFFTAFYIFIVIFQCVPVQFYWYRWDPEQPVSGTCNGDLLATIPTYVSFVVSVVGDWILALLPISLVWNARMDRGSKISVSCVLALGSIASMATVIRIPYTKQLLVSEDYLYNFTDLAIWSTVEIGLGLTASSLATLKPLFRKLKILMTSSNGSQHIPRYNSRPSYNRTRSDSIFHKGISPKKLHKYSSSNSSRGGQWRPHHMKGSPSNDTYELSLAAESASTKTTVTVPLLLDQGGPLSPPPPLHYSPFTRKTPETERGIFRR